MKHLDEPVVGFRMWIADSLTLTGMIVPVPWVIGKPAECHLSHFELRSRDHDAPASDCLCGYNAYNSLGRWPTDGLYRIGNSRKQLVVGSVVGHGHIWFHKSGWRSSLADVTALAMVSSDQLRTIMDDSDGWIERVEGRRGDSIMCGEDQLRSIGEQYHCPVVPLAYLRSVAAERGNLLDKAK